MSVRHPEPDCLSERDLRRGAKRDTLGILSRSYVSLLTCTCASIRSLGTEFRRKLRAFMAADTCHRDLS